MNGRGYKRTGDFDEIIIRKRCRIEDDAEVIGDTSQIGNLDVTGNITLTGTVDGVDVAAVAASSMLTDLDVSASGAKDILKPTTAANDFEIRAGTGTAGVLVGRSTGTGTVTISSDDDGTDGAVIVNVKNNKTSAFKIKSLDTDRLTLDTTTDAICLESKGNMRAVNMIATSDVSCATLTLGGDATTGFTSPVDASNMVAGSGAGDALTTGVDNIAIGQSALNDCKTGGQNTCVGRYAGAVIGTDVCCNTCIGNNSGNGIIGGPNNTCIGSASGGTGLVSGGNNTCLGFNAQLTVDYNNCTVLGANTTASAGNQATIGNSSTTELCNAGNGVCNLGSSGRQFKDLYLSGEVKIGGNSLLAFSQPQDTTNLCAGPTQGDSLAADALRNIIIGSGSAGDSLTTGDDNIIIGTSNCATALTTGSRNIIIGGENCAKTITSGTNNVIIGTGDCADTFVFSNSVQIGDNAGSAGMGNTSVAVGASAGQAVSGAGNVCFGYNTGGSGTGKENTYLGYSASVANGKEYSVALGTRASCAESRQMVLGSSDTTTYSLTEVVPGSTDGSCHLGSTTKKFGTVYCTALDVNGSGVEGFTNPVDDTNMAAGTTAGDSLTGVGSIRNVLIGKNAGTAMTTGCTDNTCVGFEAGKTAGASTVQNTLIGASSGANATGDSNTCVGDASGFALTTGEGNTIIGQGSGNITTGTRNTCLGNNTLPTAGSDYQIAIGYQANCAASEECCIGGSNSGQSVTIIKPGRDNYTQLGGTNRRFTDLYLTGAVVDEIPAAITSADSPYTMGNTDHVIRCDTTTNLIQITLPAAGSNNGTRYIIALETDGGNDVTISRAGTDTINGATTALTLADAGSAWTVYAIGSNWYATATN